MSNTNPYDPPPLDSDAPALPPPEETSENYRRSVWSAWLFRLGVLAFVFSGAVSTITVVPEQVAAQMAIVALLAGIGVACWIGSFYLRYRWRRTSLERIEAARRRAVMSRDGGS